MRLLKQIQILENRAKRTKQALRYEDYKKEHPATKKTRNDPLFTEPSRQQTSVEPRARPPKRIPHSLGGNDPKISSLYEAHKKNHPDSKLSYEDFHRLRTRDSVDTMRVNGKPVHTKAGLALIDKESLNHHLKNGSFTMLSAENAHAKKMTPEENKQRTEQLRKKLTAMGAVFHQGKGHFFGNDETSFMVHHTRNVTPEQLENLGKEFQQHSVIHSTAGQHHLKPLYSEYAKDEMKGSGHVSGSHLKNIYSEFPGTQKVKMRLSNVSPKYHDKNGHFTFDHPGGEPTTFRFNFG